MNTSNLAEDSRTNPVAQPNPRGPTLQLTFKFNAVEYFIEEGGGSLSAETAPFYEDTVSQT
jgi:hypothetical protein